MESCRFNPDERSVKKPPPRKLNNTDRQTGDTDKPRNDIRKKALPHLDALYRHASPLSLSNHELKDLIEETYLAVAENSDSDTSEDELKIRLFSTLRNIYIDHYRDSGETSNPPEQKPVLYEQKLHDAPLGVEDDNQEPFFSHISSEEISRAMNGLPEQYLSCVDLAVMEDFSYAEVADILNRPRETVKSQLHQGLNTIKKDLVENAIGKGLLPTE